MAQRIAQPKGAPSKKQQIQGIMNRRDLGHGLATDLWKYRNTSGYDDTGQMQRIQQRLFDQGIIKNTHAGGWFDPSVLRATPGGYVNLMTGVRSGWNNTGTGAGTSMVPDERLNLMRQRSNYNPEVAAGSQTGQRIAQYPDWLTNVRAQYGAGAVPSFTPQLPGVSGVETAGRPRTNVGYGGGRQISPVKGGGGKTPMGREGAGDIKSFLGGTRAAPQGGKGAAPAQAGQGAGMAPPNFLPMTAAYEATRRDLADQLAAAESQYGIGSEQIAPWLNLQTTRAGTDLGYDQARLNEQLANRGVYESGITPYLFTRDIGIPYGRQMQDLALSAANQYSDLGAGLGSSYLGYDQGMLNALLQRAADVASQMPLSVPQGGFRNLFQTARSPSKGKGGKKGGRKNRSRKGK